MSRARASPHRNADGDSPEEERGDGENTRERDRGPDYDEHCEGADPGEPAAEDRCSHDQQRGCCHRDGGCEEPSGGAHIFRVRSSSARDGSNLGMVGYPLGNRLSLNQGTIIWIGTVKGAPLLAVRMLGAEGASGAPFIDDLGRVVGILQIGLGSKDVIGQRTSGVVEGFDLVRWWGPTRAARPLSWYPRGGIAGCQPPAAPVPVTPEPTPLTIEHETCPPRKSVKRIQFNSVRLAAPASRASGLLRPPWAYSRPDLRSQLPGGFQAHPLSLELSTSGSM